MPNGFFCVLKIKRDFLKLHNKCPNNKCNCKKEVKFTPKQFHFGNNRFKGTIRKIFKGSKNVWDNFLKLALKTLAPFIGMAVGAESKSSQVGQDTASILKPVSSKKSLHLADMYGHGLGLRVI